MDTSTLSVEQVEQEAVKEVVNHLHKQAINGCSEDEEPEESEGYFFTDAFNDTSTNAKLVEASDAVFAAVGVSQVSIEQAFQMMKMLEIKSRLLEKMDVK